MDSLDRSLFRGLKVYFYIDLISILALNKYFFFFSRNYSLLSGLLLFHFIFDYGIMTCFISQQM